MWADIICTALKFTIQYHLIRNEKEPVLPRQLGTVKFIVVLVDFAIFSNEVIDICLSTAAVFSSNLFRKFQNCASKEVAAEREEKKRLAN